MTKKVPKSNQTDDLRRRAEKRITDSMDDIGEMSAPEIQKLIHEFNVHQIELEMQNEALQRSQAETAGERRKYTDLYDFAPVGYFTLDNKGHIIEANVTGASLLGAEKRSLARQPFQRFIILGYFSIFQSHLQKAHETQSKQICKLKLTGKDGAQFDALIDTIAVIDGKGKFDHYRSSVTDITEITRAEALRESETKYRGLYESTRDGMVMTDTEGHILECNRAYLEMLGYDGKEIKGLTYQQMTPAKWHDMEKDIVKNRVLETGYSDIYEKEYIRKDGTVFPVFIRMWAIKDETGNVTGMWGIVSNITERKQAEEALRASQERYRYLVRHAPTGIYEVDLTARKFLSVNDAMCEYTGYTREEFLSMDPIQLLTEESKQSFIQTHAKVLAGEPVPGNLEYQIKRKNGSEFWVLLNNRYSYEPNNRVFSTVIAHDITERKQAEGFLRESENRYRELSIIDDLTQLYNSRYFYHQLKMEIDRADRYGQSLTLLVLDLDNFKQFNDTYGHIEGDRVLSRLGQIVKRCLRQTDSAYRYGGEELTILLPMTTSEDGAVTAERIRAELKKESFSAVSGKDVYITVSIGLAQYKSHEDMKSFVNRVDQLMYQAKKNGKDRVCPES